MQCIRASSLSPSLLALFSLAISQGRRLSISTPLACLRRCAQQQSPASLLPHTKAKSGNGKMMLLPSVSPAGELDLA
ncbi:hypothetical protein SEVIR_7G118650v4 [Setaria viridis]